MAIRAGRGVAFVAALALALAFGGPLALAADTPAETAIKFAPKDCVGIVHIDGKALADFAAKLAKAVKDKEDLAEPAALINVAAEKAPKVEAIDVYLVTAGQRLPLPVIVFRTKMTVQDVFDAMMQAEHLPPEAKKPEMTKGENGRYNFGLGRMCLIDGKAATDIGEDLIVLLDQKAQEVTTFKAGLAEGVAAMVKKADTAAPAWGVLAMPPDSAARIPKSIVGALYLDGKKASTVTMTFNSAEDAQKMETEMGMVKLMFKDLFEFKRNEADMVLSATLDDKLPDKVTDILIKGVERQKQMRSASNLHMINSAIRTYATQKNSPPPTLEALVEAKMLRAEALVSPVSGRKLKTNDAGVPTEPGDYVYVSLPAGAAADLVQAHEKPDLNKDKGANVLFVDGSVRYLDADALKAAIEKTQEAIKGK